MSALTIDLCEEPEHIIFLLGDYLPPVMSGLV